MPIEIIDQSQGAYIIVTPATRGVKGEQGIQGETGPQGLQGEVGLQGTQGIQGIQGEQGIQGIKGDTGAKGDTGSQGIQGIQGPLGLQGIQGEVGPQGVIGPQGIQGVIGPQGLQGLQGEIGPLGPQGTIGPQGIKGDDGLGITEQAIGFTLTGGTTPKTLTVSLDGSVSGSNTGDQTLSGLGGVASNTAITGATKTKITYDAKGLVTSGSDATTTDIADSTNKRYITDAQQAALHSAVSITDTTSINLSLTGQALSADAIMGTTAGTICDGADTRLSNARTPSAHDQAESTITFTNITSGDVSTTAHGFVPIAPNDITKSLQGDGTWGQCTPRNNSVTAQGGGTVFATDVYLVGSRIVFPYTPRVGTTYRCIFDVTKTNAGTAAPVINVRIGTAGTTSDTSRATLTFGVGTAVAATGLFEVIVLFRTIGSSTSAVVQTISRLDSLPATGVSSTIKSVSATSGGFDSTVASLGIGLSYNGGTSAVHTVQLVRAELIM